MWIDPNILKVPESGYKKIRFYLGLCVSLTHFWVVFHTYSGSCHISTFWMSLLEHFNINSVWTNMSWCSLLCSLPMQIIPSDSLLKSAHYHLRFIMASSRSKLSHDLDILDVTSRAPYSYNADNYAMYIIHAQLVFVDFAVMPSDSHLMSAHYHVSLELFT